MATCPRTHILIHTHSHTHKPPTAGIQLVDHTSINIECDIGIRRVQTDKHATGRHLRSHAYRVYAHTCSCVQY